MSSEIWREIMKLMGINEEIGIEEAVDMAIHNLSKTINFLTNPFVYVIATYFVYLWVSITIPMSLFQESPIFDDGPIDILIYFIVGPICYFVMLILWEVFRSMKVKSALIALGFLAIVLLYMLIFWICVYIDTYLHLMMYKYRYPIR